jgi:male sterility protein
MFLELPCEEPDPVWRLREIHVAMRECAYPIVPLTDGHGISIGTTAIHERARFGIYAQAELAQDADRIARGIDEASCLRRRRPHDRRGPRGARAAGAAGGARDQRRAADGRDGLRRHGAAGALPAAHRPSVVVLVRARDDEHARERLRETLRCALGSDAPWPGRVRALAGDITQDGLGLEPDVALRVAGEVSEIVHGAASVSFDLALSRSRAINVAGTRRMLAFAELCELERGLRRFTYVSTAYVAGLHR